MIGRDYQLVGTEEGIKVKIKETLGKGPIQIKFLNNDVIGIIDGKKNIHVQSLSRGLITRVISDPLDRLKDEIDDSGIIVEEEALSDRNVNMLIQDICPVFKKNVVICGKSHKMELLETTNWKFENYSVNSRLW